MTTEETLNHHLSERIQHVPKSFLREILKFTSLPGIISFAGGLPNPDYFPTEFMHSAAQKILQEDGISTLQYSTTEGFLPLREWICNYYHKEYQLLISPDQVLITNGSQQGLDLLGKVLINPSEKVLIEEPSYLGAIQAFSLYQPQFLSLPLQDDGPDVDSLKKIITYNQIKLMYAVCDFQNPTGTEWSQEKREIIGDLLRTHSILSIEDNPYGEINFTKNKISPLKKYTSETGILLGSFSKIISPGLRTGWIVASKPIMEKLIIAKQASDLHSGLLYQKMIYSFVNSDLYSNHLHNLKLIYKDQKDSMISSMKKYFPKEVKYKDPNGGMFVWVTLPEYIDAYELFKESIEEEVAFVPGQTFYQDNKGKNTMRLNFSNSTKEEIQKGIQILGKLIESKIKR
jgi:2-aminoadipate transaminase